jgi:hypothetical protein
MPPTIAEKFSPETKSIPQSAFRLETGAFEFAAGEASADGTKAPIKMLGRSAEPIFHWYWGKIIHDMEGFSTDHPTVPVDWCHDATWEEGIGYLNKFKADKKGLFVEGDLVSIEPTDRAAKLMKKSAAGVPYQASIFFRAERIEQVPEGFSAKVNGFDVEGPAIIVRQWALRGMAVCLYGADHRTQSKFSDGDQVPVDTFSLETSMTKATKPAATQPAESTQLTDNKPAETQLTTNATNETVPTQLTEKQADDPRAELKKFVSAFGAENGANWYSEGLKFSDAQTKFVGTLQERLAAKDKEIEALKQKLSSIDRGSDKPLTLSSPDAPPSQQPNEFAHLGDNMSKFASGLKLPVPSKN